MKITVALLSLAMCFCALEENTFGEEKETSITLDFSDPNTFVRLIHDLVEKAGQQGYLSVQQESSLRNWAGQLIGDKVLKTNAKGCQALIEERIGKDYYNKLVTNLRKLLSVSNAPRQYKGTAILALGYPLFAVEAEDDIKKL